MVVIHNLLWLKKLGQEGGGAWRCRGALPLGQIVGNWATAVQGVPQSPVEAQRQGREKRLKSPSLGTEEGRWPIVSGKLKRIVETGAKPWTLCLTRDLAGLLHTSRGHLSLGAVAEGSSAMTGK